MPCLELTAWADSAYPHSTQATGQLCVALRSGLGQADAPAAAESLKHSTNHQASVALAIAPAQSCQQQGGYHLRLSKQAHSPEAATRTFELH